MTEVGITGVGAYIPYRRLKRSTIGEAWGIPAMGGERAVASADEDPLTMATEAAITATSAIEPRDIDAVIFASTTAPYKEKQSAATIAAVLDCRPEVFTLDLGDSLRAGTTALRVAFDMIRAGSAQVVVVCASDVRLGEPESTYEQMFGDAGAAVVLSSRPSVASIKCVGGVAREFVGPWRRDEDQFVRSYESKLEVSFGYIEQAVAAAGNVLEEAGVAATDITRAVIAGPDPRSQAAVAGKVGIAADAVQDSYFSSVGNTGTTAPLLMLAGALESAAGEDTLLLVGAGDGADALVIVSFGAFPPTMAPMLESKGYLDTYEGYVRARKLVWREHPPMWSSPVTYWRDTPSVLPLYGITCASCGTVQFPAWENCMECSAPGPHERTKLIRTGRVFTFTLDHLVLGEYLNEPVPKAVVDLDGGGRIFCDVTDCEPGDVEVGMPVELTFRLLHEGAGFRNYFWKARPPRVAALVGAD